MNMRALLFALLGIGALSVVASEPAFARDDCNCSRPRVVARSAPQQVCVTQCMSNADWAACATKSWFADSKDRSHATPRFTSRCGTVCKPYNFPRMGYRAASGSWVVFRFGPNS